MKDLYVIFYHSVTYNIFYAYTEALRGDLHCTSPNNLTAWRISTYVFDSLRNENLVLSDLFERVISYWGKTTKQEITF